MFTDAADGTDTSRLTVLGGQDATAVGIGTASPAVLIHGTASAPELRITSSSDSNTPAARMYYTAGSGWNFRLGDAANNAVIRVVIAKHMWKRFFI